MNTELMNSYEFSQLLTFLLLENLEVKRGKMQDKQKKN